MDREIVEIEKGEQQQHALVYLIYETEGRGVDGSAAEVREIVEVGVALYLSPYPSIVQAKAVRQKT